LNNDIKRIYSLDKSTYLLSLGYKPIKVARDEENIVYFVFDGDLKEEIAKYRQNEDLQRFIRSYKELKKYIRKL